MKHIAILFEKNDHDDGQQYFIDEISKIWRSDGFEVSYLHGLDNTIDADLILLHVDQTFVPIDYMKFLNSYPLVMNKSVKTIAKRSFSNNILRLGEKYQGSVILKTNLNGRGCRERYSNQKKTFMQSSIHSLREKLPWSLKARALDDYIIYDSVKELSPLIWFNRNLIIEKFPIFYTMKDR